MSDYEVDEDTIVVKPESCTREGGMNTRMKKLPDATVTHEFPAQTISEVRPEVRSRSVSNNQKNRIFRANRSKRWPEEFKEFTLQHMHQHHLYSNSPTDAEALQLIEELKCHLSISHRPELDTVMLARAKEFISTSTKDWHNDGLLIESWQPTGLSYRRTAFFDAQLKLDSNQHVTVEALVSGSNSKRQEEQSESDDIQPRKRRKRLPSQAVKVIDIEKDPPRAANKLQTPPGSASGEDPGYSMSETGTDHFDISTDVCEPTQQSTVSGWVAINTPVNSVTKIHCQMPEEILNSTIKDQEYALEVAVSPTQPNAQHSQPEMAPRFSPPPTASVEVSPETIQQSKSPSSIQFIVQQSNGALDFAHPLPSIRHLTVPSMLSLFSTRSGYKSEDTQALTFDVIFAGRSKLVLRREDSEMEWRSLKRKISCLFEDVRVSRPDEVCFEVWVKAGEMQVTDGEGWGIEKDEFEGL